MSFLLELTLKHVQIYTGRLNTLQPSICPLRLNWQLTLLVGAQIGKWYRTRFWTSVYCAILGCEFEPQWWQTLYWNEAEQLHFFHNSLWFIWFDYLSVNLFFKWIVKQKIQIKWNLFLKQLDTLTAQNLPQLLGVHRFQCLNGCDQCDQKKIAKCL